MCTCCREFGGPPPKKNENKEYRRSHIRSFCKAFDVFVLIVHLFVSYAHVNLCHFFLFRRLAATSACDSSWTFLFTFLPELCLFAAVSEEKVPIYFFSYYVFEHKTK